ncbi:hypothetical protein CCGE525_27100 (plasmid) [Rhizobium jaguaris]|uniref:Uncharacterized protein n=1 Tax=Rhizobium jaguaris TaxID=1312183 RepID=A0A387FXH3_9HYPH|nr:hypothetical protein CCGE525_27100 [Rhizobium jaguaris]
MQHEIERADEAVPLAQHVAEIRSRALAKAKLPPAAPLMKEELDALWGQGHIVLLGRLSRPK